MHRVSALHWVFINGSYTNNKDINNNSILVLLLHITQAQRYDRLKKPDPWK